MTEDTTTLLQDTLRKIAPFNLLDDDTRSQLVRHGRSLQPRRGEPVCARDPAADGMCVVIEGEIKRFLLSASGAEMVIQLVVAGDSFGEDTALLGRSSLVCAQATRDSHLLLLRNVDLRAAMAHCPAFAAALGTHLAATMYDVLENLQVCMQRNSMQRVAHYLSRLAPANTERCEIRLETDKQTIAAQLNLTPETLSRVLARLTRDGMIRPQGRRGLVLNKVTQLRSYAAG